MYLSDLIILIVLLTGYDNSYYKRCHNRVISKALGYKAQTIFGYESKTIHLSYQPIPLFTCCWWTLFVLDQEGLRIGRGNAGQSKSYLLISLLTIDHVETINIWYMFMLDKTFYCVLCSDVKSPAVFPSHFLKDGTSSWLQQVLPALKNWRCHQDSIW